MKDLEREVLLALAREAVRTGEAVRLRLAAGLLPGDMAKLAEVSRPTIVRYEARFKSPTGPAGRWPSGAAGLRYARVLVRLGMKVRELAS